MNTVVIGLMVNGRHVFETLKKKTFFFGNNKKANLYREI